MRTFLSLSLSLRFTRTDRSNKSALALSLSTNAEEEEEEGEEEGARDSTKERCSLYHKRGVFLWGNLRAIEFSSNFFLKEAKKYVSKHRLDDARVHRRVHIPGPLGGVLSDWCVLFFFCFLSL